MPFDLSTATPVEDFDTGGFDLSTAKPEGRKTPLQMMPEKSGWEKFISNLSRQGGLTARAGIEGMLSPASMVGGALGMDTGPALSRNLTRLGLPVPETGMERIAQDVAGSMAGTGGINAISNLASKAATSPAVANALMKMTEGAGIQTGAAAAGGAGAGTARELGAGPLGQTVAGLAASMAVPAVPIGAKTAIRGGEKTRAIGEQRIKQFGESGVTPSVAQAFPSHQAQAYESFLSRGPGSHGIMRDFAESQAGKMGAKVDEVANILSGKTSPMIAGRAVEQGITGEGGFTQKFRATESALYGHLDNYIKEQTPVDTSRTTQALKLLNEDIPNAPNLSAWFKNAKIQGIEEALGKDMAGKPAKVIPGKPPTPSPVLQASGKPFVTPGTPPTVIPAIPAKTTMPYESIKKLRTLVGRELADANIISDVPRSKWKTLYAALSQDLHGAAQLAGPEAERSWKRANSYSRAGHQRIESIIDPVLAKGDPEKIFGVIFRGGKEGDTVVHGIMQSLPPAGQKVLAASVLRKLGKGTPGEQSATGDVFSIARYLTNWNTLSPEAKRSLFSRYGKDFNKNLDTIAKTAEDIKMGAKVYANPSGTAPALTLQHTAGGMMIALLTGHIGVAGAIAGEVTLADMSAKAFTNPKFVRWLAKSSKVPAALLPISLNQLSQIGKRTGDQELIDMAQVGQQAISKPNQ